MYPLLENQAYFVWISLCINKITSDARNKAAQALWMIASTAMP
jgi:hypothetical protein